MMNIGYDVYFTNLTFWAKFGGKIGMSHWKDPLSHLSSRFHFFKIFRTEPFLSLPLELGAFLITFPCAADVIICEQSFKLRVISNHYLYKYHYLLDTSVQHLYHLDCHQQSQLGSSIHWGMGTLTENMWIMPEHPIFCHFVGENHRTIAFNGN